MPGVSRGGEMLHAGCAQSWFGRADAATAPAFPRPRPDCQLPNRDALHQLRANPAERKCAERISVAPTARASRLGRPGLGGGDLVIPMQAGCILGQFESMHAGSAWPSRAGPSARDEHASHAAKPALHWPESEPRSAALCVRTHCTAEATTFCQQ